VKHLKHRKQPKHPAEPAPVPAQADIHSRAANIPDPEGIHRAQCHTNGHEY
jgi:hypothetical protein